MAMAISYHKGEHGMLYPNIEAEQEKLRLGKFGIMAMEYLEQNHRGRYQMLKMMGRLNEVLQPVEEEANQLLEATVKAYLKKHQPKQKDSTMEMWKIREQAQRMAEEIVMTEVINKYH